MPTTVSQYTLERTQLEAGDAIELECFESHDPRLTLTWNWKHNNDPVNTKNAHYKMTGGVLGVRLK